ncbi:MAG: hypothetical protein HY594_00885 [Candidatus Omnitrophica bacterium]|nr:hypothetical protein [Candidatus Omnitrophota bacterium]
MRGLSVSFLIAVFTTAAGPAQAQYALRAEGAADDQIAEALRPAGSAGLEEPAPYHVKSENLLFGAIEFERVMDWVNDWAFRSKMEEGSFPETLILRYNADSADLDEIEVPLVWKKNITGKWVVSLQGIESPAGLPSAPVWLPPQPSVEGDRLILTLRRPMAEALVEQGILERTISEASDRPGVWYRMAQAALQKRKEAPLFDTSAGRVALMISGEESGGTGVLCLVGRSGVEVFTTDGFYLTGRYGVAPDVVVEEVLKAAGVSGFRVAREGSSKPSQDEPAPFLLRDPGEDQEVRKFTQNAAELLGLPLPQHKVRAPVGLAASQAAEIPAADFEKAIQGWIKADSLDERWRALQQWLTENLNLSEEERLNAARLLMETLEAFNPLGWSESWTPPVERQPIVLNLPLPAASPGPASPDLRGESGGTAAAGRPGRPFLRVVEGGASKANPDAGLEELARAIRWINDTGAEVLQLDDSYGEIMGQAQETLGSEKAQAWLMRVPQATSGKNYGRYTFFIYQEWATAVTTKFPLYGEGGPTVVPVNPDDLAASLPQIVDREIQLIIWSDHPLEVEDDLTTLPQLIAAAPDEIGPEVIGQFYAQKLFSSGSRIFLATVLQDEAGQQYVLFYA